MTGRRQRGLVGNDCRLAPAPDLLPGGRESVLLPRLLLKSEVAGLLRYRSVRSVERLIARGELDVVQVSGRQVRIDAASLAAFLERATRRARGLGAASEASTEVSFGTIEPESLRGERP